MGETIMLQRPKINHRLICEGIRVDPFGAEYTLYSCPQCGFQQAIWWSAEKGSGRLQTLQEAPGELTEQDAVELAELCKSPAGRLEAARRLAQAAQVPGHSIMETGTEDQWRKVVAVHGKAAEFDAAVDQAIIEGKPLLKAGMGEATAETWPKGTGPFK